MAVPRVSRALAALPRRRPSLVRHQRIPKEFGFKPNEIAALRAASAL